MLGEPPEDPLALFWVLYGFWAVNYVAFNEKVAPDLAAQFLALAREQGDAVPIMIGHRLVGCTLLGSGEIGPSWTHFDQAITLYNPAEHHQAAARFAPDITMMSISWRALASWMLGHPEAALPALDRALALAREIGRAVDLKFVLIGTQPTRIQSGDYATARAQLDEGLAWRMKKALRPGRPWGRCSRVAYSPLPASLRSPCRRLSPPSSPTVRQGRHCTWPFTCPTWRGPMPVSDNSPPRGAASAKPSPPCKRPEPSGSRPTSIASLARSRSCRRSTGVAEAEVCFERALAIARAQQTRSWELRAATSLARLWRDQGSRAEARDLLAPVYG